ncbi:MAG: Sensor histidine kinase RcsC [Chroococcopsis gigantea SAG 12.99]|jgi:chemotaxis family two-component system sensor histidine kinase/response regulator PixL|nr:hybrid sensor histidine kinase/response regulator [Chlorogloea purpurea SAG 13.99]MDV3000492.1 Sensor histidine kinase RcsC [Chroococcopsis gigantea SAG 12.99]
MNSEQEMRLLFLDEAIDYINSIEQTLLQVTESPTFVPSSWDEALRAAHSLKGGSAMMGYEVLSDIAHRLEDFFKIIKANRLGITPEVGNLLLQCVDYLRLCADYCRHPGQGWSSAQLTAIFEVLEEHLGQLQPQDEMFLLTDDQDGEDITVFLFETEVDTCLQRLENLLADNNDHCLREEFQIAAQELGGLGEMLQLPQFTALCAAIDAKLHSVAHQDLKVLAARVAQEWRRVQAMVLVGQKSAIPTDIQEFVTVDLPDDREDTLPSLEDWSDEDIAVLSIPGTVIADLAAPIPTGTGVTPFERRVERIGANETNTIRVPVSQLENLGDLIGELTIERNGLNLQLSGLNQLMELLRQRIKVLGQSNQNLRNVYDSGLSNSGSLVVSGAIQKYFDDQLEMDRYNDLHHFIQEVMETIVKIEEVTEDIDINLDTVKRTARQLTRTERQIQNSITQVRMRPFRDVAAQLPRAVRDMNVKYGKAVELEIIGEEVLIDRTILDALTDPLFHLIRNAFDHGIEDPLTRASAGKSQAGKITLKAFYRGNQTLIVISDDGGGINLDKICAAAGRLGLSGEDIAKISKQDLLNLIFEPGFSTANQVTDLSGRGMGMDIVRAKVEQVRGSLSIDTEQGKGTTFTITVPFTLSVVRVLLVESGGMLMAFPTSVVEEMVMTNPQMILNTAGKNFLDWEGYLIPLINLRSTIVFNRSYFKPETMTVPVINQPTVLLVACKDELIGLEVDSYWGEQEVTIRSVDGFFPLPCGFTSCTILGDGRVVPLVDVDTLIDSLLSVPTPPQIPRLDRTALLNPPVNNRREVIMVVDDSINVRRFLALTLEKAGYRIQQAKDGQEALEKLQEGVPVQAVICDVEMPRLDGYGFLAHARSNSQFRSLPIIMLTSRSGDKHRQIALNLGADGYFSKPFQEQELLNTLKSIINQTSSL